MGSTLLLIEKATIDPLHLWVIKTLKYAYLDEKEIYLFVLVLIFQSMKKLHTDELLESLDYESLGTCEPCLMGKMTKTPFSKTMERATDLLEIILMTHKYRGSIVVLSISKSVEPNEEQKEMISGFQQGILCKY